jgi:hypothetical protein
MTHRGSDWVVLVLGYRLALGVATSIFFINEQGRLFDNLPFFSCASIQCSAAFTGLNAFMANTRPIKRARIGSGTQRHTCGTSGRRN